MRLWSIMALAFGPLAFASAQGIPIVVGQETVGALETTDAQLDRTGEFYDAYTFYGTANQILSIRLNSTEIDPYVILYYPDNSSQTENDDFQGTLNSGLDITLPETGQYRVLATSYAPGETGSYTLSLSAGGAAPPVTAQPMASPPVGQSTPLPPQQPWSVPPVTQPQQPVNPWGAQPTTQPSQQPMTPWGAAVPQQQPATPPPSWGGPPLVTPSGPLTPWGVNQPQSAPQTPPPSQAPPGGGPIGLNQTMLGQLAPGDAMLTSGEYHDVWEFQGQAGQQITVSLDSDQFDCYLIVVASNGQQLENDDFAQSTNSQVSMVLPQSGLYQILATSFAPGETGVYRVTVH